MKIVLFDRDGTLIDFVRDEETGAVVSAFHPSHVRPLPFAREAVQALKEAGFLTALVTNQPGAAKGQITREAIEKTNAHVAQLFDLDWVEVCLHHPTGGPGGDPTLVCPCTCRKPGSRMLQQAVSRLGRGEADMANVFMIGDTIHDVRAAEGCGARAVWVTGEGCKTCAMERASLSTAVLVSSIQDAAAHVLRHAGR